MRKTDLSIVVLISGRGSNLLSLLQHSQFYRVSGIISNREDAPGLAFGAEFGVPTAVVARSQFDSADNHRTALRNAIAAFNPDFICLAGFMQIIRKDLLAAYPHRIINIHPSLLPDLAGLDTHRRALSTGITEHGCTVHLVDSGIDTGPIIAQAAVPVLPTDDEASLSQRVLTQEHRLYPHVLNALGKGDLSLNGGRVRWQHLASEELQRLKFRFPANSVLSGE